jgi:phosphoglycolate phosphatase-like HAD superfamily hydrolase
MARYTKQIRKRRQRTKKLKNARRTKRYKIKYGGLGPLDQEKIGITDRWSFQDGNTEGLSAEDTDGRSKADKIREFEIYIFGSREHAELWKQIMQECKKKGIRFFILTSGNKISIIRTLQLLELDHLVEEVLCNNDRSPTTTLLSSERERFRKLDKCQIIKQVVDDAMKVAGHESGLEQLTQENTNTVFIDDQEANLTISKINIRDNVKLIHAKGVKTVSDAAKKTKFYEKSKQLLQFCNENTFHTSYNTSEYDWRMLGSVYAIYKESNINLIEVGILEQLLSVIMDNSFIKFGFVDFDGTMSPWAGGAPVHIKTFEDVIRRYYNIISTSLQPPPSE